MEQLLLDKKSPSIHGKSQYYSLPLLNKVEIFQQVIEETTGQDLAKMLWLKSKTADVWVERRAAFTRSNAGELRYGYGSIWYPLRYGSIGYPLCYSILVTLLYTPYSSIVYYSIVYSSIVYSLLYDIPQP